MNTKICITCEQELPLKKFRKSAWGGTTKKCEKCIMKTSKSRKIEKYYDKLKEKHCNEEDPGIDQVTVDKNVQLDRCPNKTGYINATYYGDSENRDAE